MNVQVLESQQTISEKLRSLTDSVNPVEADHSKGNLFCSLSNQREPVTTELLELRHTCECSDERHHVNNFELLCVRPILFADCFIFFYCPDCFNVPNQSVIVKEVRSDSQSSSNIIKRAFAVKKHITYSTKPISFLITDKMFLTVLVIHRITQVGMNVCHVLLSYLDD